MLKFVFKYNWISVCRNLNSFCLLWLDFTNDKGDKCLHYFDEMITIFEYLYYGNSY